MTLEDILRQEIKKMGVDQAYIACMTYRIGRQLKSEMKRRIMRSYNRDYPAQRIADTFSKLRESMRA
jgi:hypothetical protein